METQQNCAKREMTDAELIRAVYPRHTMKSLARAMDAPLETARSWLYRSFSPARRRELAVALIAEFDRQEQERSVVRASLVQMAGEAIGDDGTTEVGSLVAGLGDRPANEAMGSAQAATVRASRRAVG